MCRFLVEDLYAACPAFRELAGKGKIVYQTNFTVNRDKPSRWTIDLVVGPRSGATQALSTYGLINSDPESIWLAIDAKSIMTEHGKARRNRQRDLNSMADILHRTRPEPVIGAFMIVNIADRFKSPLRNAITQHHNISRIVAEIVPMMEDVLRDRTTGKQGLDAIAITVVSFENLPGSKCALVNSPPAPSSSSPLNYAHFLAKICEEFSTRFGTQ